ncbi:hypothetical protein SAMN05444156_0614 [Verrucomicrobium sp. GAS474]|uniref:hypothetical protein n=1 Tax=Verrucomicrobium sp. GAS474 TaxID=1882831 RepID=UPI00087BDFED|nr:hypothetical protein [Verrucomicrobium sp. GAS474]SDT90588.1 hypothetical protein SAMN05444156_0614 [Verrucomicrobium sp. GAS474]
MSGTHPHLRLTDTNAADDSGGSVWGLDGNLFLPVVASATLSIGVLLVLFAAFHVNWLASALIAAVPFSGTLAYVLLLKQSKPPGYDLDLFDLWINGRGFSLVQRGQTLHRRPLS